MKVFKVFKVLKNVDYEDVAKRAIWTFLEAFMAIVVFGLEPIINLIFEGDFRGVYALAVALVVGGISAGLSAVKTLSIELVRALRDKSGY